MQLSYLLPGGIAALAALIGVIRTDAQRPDPVGLLAAGVATVGFAVFAAGQHEPDVPVGDAVAGVALAGVMLGALPVYVFFLAGRSLAQDRIALALICAANAVALVYYYAIGFFYVLGLVHCPPDAGECPF
jgi:hypothetical protein